MIEYAALLGLTAGALGAADTLPYLRDTLRRTTVPHRGSWLIWGVLEVVAVESQRADGATWSLVPLVTQALGTCLVFAFAVRLGSGGLGPMDVTLIAVAGAGVAGWLLLDEPVIATVCVIAADFVAALMMLPKTWSMPQSETLSTFVLASLGGLATVGAVGSLSVSLLIYPIYFTLVNAALAAVIHQRRRVLRDSTALRRDRATAPLGRAGTVGTEFPPPRRVPQSGQLAVVTSPPRTSTASSTTGDPLRHSP